MSEARAEQGATSDATKTAANADPLARYGPQPRSGSSLMRRCRLLQSCYRVDVAKQAECGPWRAGAEAVGSSLVHGATTGANFISPTAFAYAKDKVKEKQTNRDLTIDEYRLFNNMLSSQPMCFNLFADLRLGVQTGWPDAHRVLAAMFAESGIETVLSVEVEMIPLPKEDYIDDKTAFDALVRLKGIDGGDGIAAVETKYTDDLGSNTASLEDRKFALAGELGLLTDDGARYYRDRGFDQLARNLLLTLAFARRHGIRNAINYVMGPQEDDETPRMIEALRERLTPSFRDRVAWLPLEVAVARGASVAGPYYTDCLLRFRQRYLDFGRVQTLLDRK